MGGFVTRMARELVMRQIYVNGIQVALRVILVKAYVVYYDGCSQVNVYAVYRLNCNFQHVPLIMYVGRSSCKVS